MKVLWLNSNLLLPLDKGGKLRTWHVLRSLAERHEITYLSFADPSAPAEDYEGMRAVCNRLLTVPRVDTAKGTLQFQLDAARHLIDPVPYAIAKYRSRSFRVRLNRLLESEPFDVIVCDFLVPAINMPRRLPCPAVLFTHNVEADIWRRHAAHAGNPLRRALLRSQWHRMLRYESATLARFDHVLVVSDADGATLHRLYPGSLHSDPHLIQTGVDTQYFKPRLADDRVRGGPGEARRAAHLVFTGSMDWLPNEDAMVYFARDIFPRIRAAEPGATLSIIGREPTPAVRGLAEDPGIEVVGRVDDVRPHIAAGSVYVVPLRIGGGTRLKIFEAMAMGKAVVSTTVGAEGLPVTSGVHLLIEDEPDAFARAVVQLIRDDAARHRLEAAARDLVVDRYDWSRVAWDFEKALARGCALGRPAWPSAPDGGDTRALASRSVGPPTEASGFD
jgi:sugar transferase (PEP-CTERM/EpsH1 system associated)